MKSEDGPAFDLQTGLLVDTNLLVLFIVGGVNRKRIPTFKRTSAYSQEDYELLCRVIERFDPLVYTVAHVMAEVSNLTDLRGRELLQARALLKSTVSLLREPHVPSVRATEERCFERLGITDAAIFVTAEEHGCTVLTDDLDLYLALSQSTLPVINFTHLRERSWQLQR